MKIFKRIKWSYVVLSVMFLLLGIYLVVNPETSLIMICRILGAAMAVFGVMKIVLYFIREVEGVAIRFDFAVGLFCIILGALMLWRAPALTDVLSVMIGLLVLVDSVFKLQVAVDSRRMGAHSWWVTLVCTVVCLVLGVLLVFNPFNGKQVREHRRAQRARKLARLGHLGKAGGILRVQTELIGDQRMQGVEAPVLRLELLRAAAAPAQHRAKAAVDARLRDGLAEIVHVKAGGDAAREVFEDRQLRERIHRLGRELGLQREDLLEQPRLQRHIVGIRAHKAHPGVRVRVFEAGHHKVAAEIDLPLERGQCLRRRTDIGDLVPVGPDLVGRDGHAVRHRERAAVEKADHSGASVF